VKSSYAVEDRVQVADVDPGVVIEDFEDENDSLPCPICGDDDNEDVLLLCDGCDAAYHTYCVDLDSVPPGHWFCDSCETQRALNPYSVLQAERRTHHPADRRTRGQLRRRRVRTQVTTSQWARVWQQVWDRLNLDLDFPFDEDDEPSLRGISQRREITNGRDYQALERRLQVAEQQGGGVRFRTAALRALRHPRPSRPKPQTPEPESQEELRAWNAFEKAQEIEINPNRRKRKSATASPAEPPSQSQPERKLKRPRTRRNVDLADAAESAAESSSARSGHRSPTNTNRRNVGENAVAGPSFLQSLLKEVEDSSSAENKKGGYRPSPIAITPAVDRSSPRPSSPALSPHASNHSSPRATSATPPPYSAFRPSSPTPLTSKVEPVFPAPDFSPSRSPPPERIGRNPTAQPKPVANARVPVWVGDSSPSASRPRSKDSSPTRPDLSLGAKTDVQKMVAAALNPYWKKQEVSKDQFTDINRNISRKLYDRVEDLGVLDQNNREGWEKVANEEVSKAVEALKS
jgi:hypothetical protein